MSVGRLWLACLLVATGSAACRGAPPVLPPVPASSGLVMVKPEEAPSVRTGQALIDRVVAVVNGDVIMMSELQEAVILYQRETKGPTLGEGEVEELQRKVLARMVDHRLQVQEARREKVEVTEDDVRAVVDDFVRRNGGDRAQIEAQLRLQGLTWEGLRRELRDQLLAQRIRGRRVSRRANVTEAEVDAFASLSGDHNPLHCDAAYGRAAGFRDRVAHGVLLGALVSRLIGTELPGRWSLLLGLRLDFVAPTYPGDTLTVQGRVDSVHLEQRTVTIRLSITCAGETRLRGSAMVRMSR